MANLLWIVRMDTKERTAGRLTGFANRIVLANFVQQSLGQISEFYCGQGDKAWREIDRDTGMFIIHSVLQACYIDIRSCSSFQNLAQKRSAGQCKMYTMPFIMNECFFQLQRSLAYYAAEPIETFLMTRPGVRLCPLPT